MVSGKSVVAAIGNFDGVHRGHQHLLAATAAFAAERGARPGVLLFDPHPRRFFRPDDPPFLITAPAQRDALLKAHGAEEIISRPFDKALASLTPEAFVNDVLAAQLNLAGVVTGADFRFGKGRAGDGAMLKALGEAAGLGVRLLDPLLESPDTEKYGSSAVRDALRNGDVKTAARMLGRAWSVFGTVTEGQKLGRTLGFPTANFALGEIIEPRKGVYATRTRFDGKTCDAVSNYGRRPTVGADAPLLETHLFDFDGDLYGREIEVVFIDFIRDERKFDGLDALKEQIEDDCASARRILTP